MNVAKTQAMTPDGGPSSKFYVDAGAIEDPTA